MKPNVILVGAVMATLSLAACSSPSKSSTPTTAGPTSVTTPAPGSTSANSSTSSTTTNPGPPLAGQPGATSRSALGFVSGYQETAVEASGLQLLQTYEAADATPGTQVHCPAVVANIGSPFVCQVDANATAPSTLDEPLKVDTLSPLKLEFAIINPKSFVCSAHAAWVVQAMMQAGMACMSSPTTTQGQGQGQGQGNGQ